MTEAMNRFDRITSYNVCYTKLLRVFENVKPRNPVYISPYVLGGTTRLNELNESETEYVRTDDPSYNFV